MRRAAAAMSVGTMVLLISACLGGAPPPDRGSAGPAGGEAPPDHAADEPPADHASGAPPADGSGATPDRPPAGPGRTSLDGTRWTVDTAIVDGTAIPVPAGPSGSAWLAIGDGRFRAVTGCGEVEGRVRADGGTLRFSDVTEAIPIRCPAEFAPADRAMRELLTSEATFAVESGQLRLDHPGGTGLRLHAGAATWESSSAPES